MPDANVEIWHVDAAGNYSIRNTIDADLPAWNPNHQRNGEVTFTTIYPGWYQGRATHIHAEVTINGVSRKVTQIAFPEAVNNTVHTAEPIRRAAPTRCPTPPT